MNRDWLTIALPKGKLGEDAAVVIAQAGLPREGLDTDSRRLSFEYPEEKIRYIICRPTDVPTYVEYGAADLGIVGKDTIEEAQANVFELVDLKFGYCKFVVAITQEKWDELKRQGDDCLDLIHLNHTRVATKFPRVAENYFRSRGMQVEVIKLHGNIELAPRVGLAEMIVDIVSTGRTLTENRLVAMEDIFHATARLIANRVSYRMKYELVQDMVERLRQVVGDGGDTGDQSLSNP
ncbi:MAG: ATP phosphoribosyltransferase [Bacillota bacterium]